MPGRICLRHTPSKNLDTYIKGFFGSKVETKSRRQKKKLKTSGLAFAIYYYHIFLFDFFLTTKIIVYTNCKLVTYRKRTIFNSSSPTLCTSEFINNRELTKSVLFSNVTQFQRHYPHGVRVTTCPRYSQKLYVLINFRTNRSHGCSLHLLTNSIFKY